MHGAIQGAKSLSICYVMSTEKRTSVGSYYIPEKLEKGKSR